MDLTFLGDKVLLLIGLAVFCYLLLYSNYRKTILCLSDPLNTSLLLVACYFAGAFTLTTVFGYQPNSLFWEFMFLSVIFFVVSSLTALPVRRFRLPQLAMSADAQYCFVIIVGGLIVLNIIINQVFGIMPFISGSATRSDAGTVHVPSLYLVTPTIAYVEAVVAFLTEHRRVKKIAIAGLTLGIISNLLGGSKTSLLGLIDILLLYDYTLHLKKQSPSTNGIALQPQLSTIIQRLRRRIFVLCIGLAAALPFLLVFIGVGDGGGVAAAMAFMAIRLFGGFDGLIYLVTTGFDTGDIPKLDLTQLYFFPFYKAVAGPPEFQSIGEYIIYTVTSNYEFAKSGLNPNSSLPLEWIIGTQNFAIAAIGVAAISWLTFTIRNRLLNRKQIGMLGIFLWSIIITSPISVLLDGEYFMTKLYISFIFYILISILMNIMRIAVRRRVLLRIF